jgi:hypothetical protein
MGSPQFSQRGTRGSGDKVAVSERPELKAITVNQSTTLASGEAETVEMYAPTGSTYEVAGMYLYCTPPGDETSGSHNFQVSTLGAFNVTKATSGTGTDLLFDEGHWKRYTDRFPSDETAAIESVHSLIATENSPIKFVYDNNFDVSQSNTRKFRIVVKENSY